MLYYGTSFTYICLYRRIVVKKVILSCLLAISLFGLVKADPVLVTEPIVIIPKSEYDSFMGEVKKLYDEYKALTTQKSCKKA